MAAVDRSSSPAPYVTFRGTATGREPLPVEGPDCAVESVHRARCSCGWHGRARTESFEADASACIEAALADADRHYREKHEGRR